MNTSNCNAARADAVRPRQRRAAPSHTRARAEAPTARQIRSPDLGLRTSVGTFRSIVSQRVPSAYSPPQGQKQCRSMFIRQRWTWGSTRYHALLLNLHWLDNGETAFSRRPDSRPFSFAVEYRCLALPEDVF